MRILSLLFILLFSCGWTFPLSEDSCIMMNGRVKTTSWFYQERVDLPKGTIYGAMNWPTKKFAPIYSVSSGEVIWTGFDVILGVTIKVRPDDISVADTLIYGHLSDWLCKRGERLAEGQILGLTGHSGRTTLSPTSKRGVLYLEARKEGKKVCISGIDDVTGISLLFGKKWKCVEGDLTGVNNQ